MQPMWIWLLSFWWFEETHGLCTEYLATVPSHTNPRLEPLRLRQALICDSLSLEIYPSLKCKGFLPLKKVACRRISSRERKNFGHFICVRVMTGGGLCPRVWPRCSDEKATIRADCESSKCPLIATLIAHPLFASLSLLAALFMTRAINVFL